jgi:outer membrane protein OmpA-like peptidoglycan-associated protein
MTAKGYGEELPIAPNTTKEGRQRNRRVSLKIVGGP